MTVPSPWNAAVARTIIDPLVTLEGPLLPVLHALQNHFGQLPAAAIPLIADALNLSPAEVQGVISFYPFFRTAPVGRHILQVCRAEACQAVGGRELEAQVKQLTGLDYHQTAATGKLTLEPVYCLGNCACGPSLRIDGKVHGRVDAHRAAALIDSLVGDSR